MLGKNLITAAAGASEEEPLGYLAVSHSVSSTNYITLLKRPDAASLSFATTYQTVGGFGVTVLSLDFSSDGNYLVAGVPSATASVTLLDHTTPGTLTLAATYAISNGGTNGGQIQQFSPDNNYIISGGGIRFTLLDHTTPGTLSLATTYDAVGSHRGGGFSPDGNYIALGADATLTLLDHTTPGTVSLAATYVANNNLYGVSFSPDGNYIACATSTGNTITLLDHTTPGSLSLAATYTTIDFAYGAKYTPDGNYLATTIWDSTFRYAQLFNMSSPGSITSSAIYTLARRPNSSNASNALGFSPTGDYLAVCQEDSFGVALLDHTTPGSLSFATTYTFTNARSVAFSPEVTP